METKKEISLIKGNSVFKVPPAQINARIWSYLSELGQICKVRTRQTLFEQNDLVNNVYIVTQGYFKLLKNNRAIDIIEPGESLGAGLINFENNKSTYPVGAEALSNAEVIKIPTANIVRALQQNTDLNQYFFSQIQKRMFFLQIMNAISDFPVADRVSCFLKNKQHLLNQEIITRKLIAEITSTTTESVIRTIRDMEKSDIIKTNKRKIILTDEFFKKAHDL